MTYMHLLGRAGLLFAASAGICFAQTDAAASYQDTINQYCVGCHNDTLRTAGFSLQQADISVPGVEGHIWEKVLRKLHARTMPPAGMPRPDDSVYETMADYLEAGLDHYAHENPQPGRPSLRRLNRTEYSNAISDLLGVTINSETLLPPDAAMFGFDNIGTVLTLSPLLIERYIAAARIVRRQAIGEAEMAPAFEYYTVAKDLSQDDRISDDLPFGSRGGIAIRHHFPADGEYIVQIRLQKNYREYIRGMVNKPHQLDVRLDHERISLFTIGGEKHGRSSGLFSTSAQGDVDQEQYERYADEALEIRFAAKAGTRLLTANFLHEPRLPEGPQYPEFTQYDLTQYKGGNPGVRTLAVGGPYNAKGPGITASRNRIFICRPQQPNDNDEQCARRILENLAHTAYRRSPSGKEIDELMQFYRQGQARKGFEEGIGVAIERMLAGPEFLFIAEKVPANAKPGQVYRISDLEMASRLSFFLWSSLPDQELLQLAETGKLQDPRILDQQVRRMLADPRSDALVKNFASQWLTLGKLNVATPDIENFPYFDENLRQSFREETRLFVEHILREDRPLLELLDADYSFINERLAKHYGIPGIYGNHFRKVTFADETRGGLLGQGSILTVTSYANRTSPVIRGKWILENILGAPPPPPPANVPGLRDRNDQGKVLTMRERMEQHRANPVCASCHKVMDPLGFALENYDATGRWRTVDGSSGSDIDSSGALPDGTPFTGPIGLRKVLLEKRRDDFILTVVEKLMIYALGREISHADQPAIRAVLREAGPENYSLSSLIMAIVNSTPYQMRRVSDHDAI